MSDLAELVERLASSESLSQSVEEATRQAAVLPALDALGWDWRDLDEVAPEYVVRGGRVDYCLRLHGQPAVLIEVKRTGKDLTEHQEQLLRYAFEEGAPLAALTDGLLWWMYLPTETGSWEQRKFFTVDLRRVPPAQGASSLARFLSRDAVATGRAIEEARSEFASQERDRRVRVALPEAWAQLLRGPDELLAELLADAVAGIAGHRPEPESVAQFLSDLPKADAAPVQLDRARPPMPVTPSTRTERESYTGRQPIALTLDGQRREVSTWREVLTVTCELAAANAGSRFDTLVLPIRGTKRNYFSPVPERLSGPLAIEGTDLSVEGKLSANDCVRLSRRVVTAVFGDEALLTVEASAL